MDSLEDANKIFHESLSSAPTILDREVSRLNGLFEVRMNSVQVQFLNVQQQFAERKEAAAEAKANTARQLETTSSLWVTKTTAIDDKIAAIVSRLDRGDGGSSGKATQQTSALAIIVVVISAISLALAGLSLIRPSGGGSGMAPQGNVTVQQPNATGSISNGSR